MMQEVIGVLPAGGQATRVSPLPCSKELFPIGFRSVEGEDAPRPKVVSHYLLEKMRWAGIHRAYFILRQGKWDIPQYFGDGGMVNMHLAYLMMGVPFGVPYTLDQAYPFVQDSFVAFGFPDIVFQPEDAYEQLLARQTATNADVVMGLFPAVNPQQIDMVNRGQDGRICQIDIKPANTTLHYTWIIALWTPVFTKFIRAYLSSAVSESPELSLGEVLQAAIDQKLHVNSVIFPKGTYLDIGTPDDLVKAIQFGKAPNLSITKF
jgi:glucose-1-phosphate thymidylyltransferase